MDSRNYNKYPRTDNIFKTERFISIDPDIRIGVLSYKNGFKYGTEGLKYNNGTKPYRLLDICREFQIESFPITDGYPNPIKPNLSNQPNPSNPSNPPTQQTQPKLSLKKLCYDFEDGFKLCFSKYKNTSGGTPPIITLTNPEQNVLVNKQMCPSLYQAYKPFDYGDCTAQLDMIDKFIKSDSTN